MTTNLTGHVTLQGRSVPWCTRFDEDLTAAYAAELCQRGCNPAGIGSLPDLAYAFHDWRRRRLEDLVGRALRVVRAREMSSSVKYPVIARIEDLARSGQPLWPYTSKRTRSPNKKDDLLNHWGVVHFHLGEGFDENGYVDRTRELLFAHVADDALYLLGVFNHDSFQDADLLNIAIRNWPTRFEPYRIHGVSIAGRRASPNIATSGALGKFQRTVLMHPTRSVPPERVKELRAQGLNATFEAESGAHYYPPGGGYSCARTSVLCRVNADHELWWSDQLAKVTRDAIVEIVARLGERATVSEIPSVEFHIEGLDEMKRGFIVERSTATRIKLPVQFDYDFDAVAVLKCMAAAAMVGGSGAS